ADRDLEQGLLEAAPGAVAATRVTAAADGAAETAAGLRRLGQDGRRQQDRGHQEDDLEHGVEREVLHVRPRDYQNLCVFSRSRIGYYVGHEEEIGTHPARPGPDRLRPAVLRPGRTRRPTRGRPAPAQP